MLRIELAWVLLALALLAGCATKPPALPACTEANSPGAICGLMNPEDISIVPGREWVIVSQMASRSSEAEFGDPPSRPGNLLAVRVADGARFTIFPAKVGWALDAQAVGGSEGWGEESCPGPPEKETFEPHGIDVGKHASGVPMLAVVNHGGRETVEFFEIDRGEHPAISWKGCVPMPEGVSANDVALFHDGGFVVTKFMPRIESMGAGAMWNLLKIAWGMDTGTVYRWSTDGTMTEIPGSVGSAPNGIAISPDQGEIFVAQWGEKNVYRVPLGKSQWGVRRQKAELDHHPDNLSWTEDGRLLAAGQNGGLLEILGCGGIESGGCGLDYGVYSIDPDTLEATRLFSGKGAASVAVEVGDDIFVGAFSGDQIERVESKR